MLTAKRDRTTVGNQSDVWLASHKEQSSNDVSLGDFTIHDMNVFYIFHTIPRISPTYLLYSPPDTVCLPVIRRALAFYCLTNRAGKAMEAFLQPMRA